MWLSILETRTRVLVFFAAPMVARLCMLIPPIIATMNVTTLWQRICPLIPLLMPWKKFQPDPPYTSGGIIEDGDVGRAIFQSKDWKKLQRGKGQMSIDNFLDKKSPINISVFLLNFASDEDLTKIGDAMATQRGPGRSFYGWAEVSVAKASENGREVHYTPQSRNKWHADIVLPVIVQADKKKREYHAGKLARASIPRPAANPT